MKKISIDCIKFFNEGVNIEELANHFNVSINSIHRFLRKHNLGVGKKKYSYNESYFDNIDSEDKAYFLGFLYADGNVTDTNRKKTIRLFVHEKDKEILEKFNNCINYNKPIYKSKQMCYVEIVGLHIVNSAINYGLIPRKTFELKFPDLRQDLIRHFIRGFFDGDGGISLLIDKKISHKVAKLSFTSTSDFCESIRQILKTKCDANSRFYVRHPNKNTIGSLTIGGNLQSQRVLDYMYKDSTVYLERKYKLYEELCRINSL